MTESPQPEPPVIGSLLAGGSQRDGPSAPRQLKLTRLTWSALIVVMLGGASFQACIAWGCYENFLADIVERKSFSSEDWKKLAQDSSDAGRRVRQFMAEDLVGKRDLNGMSRGGIIDLLGPGDPDACFSKNSRPYVFSYRLRDQAFVDENYLVIEFDDADLVARASLRSN